MEPSDSEDAVAMEKHDNTWDNPLDPVCITVDEVASGDCPVLVVRHDPGHGGWQFYDGKDIAGRTPKVIPKSTLLELDPALQEITDLPIGWCANRASADAPWQRQPTITQATIDEAKKHPNGYVYTIAGQFGPDEDVPPEAIVGAWKVDENGELTGEFKANPNYRRKDP